MTPADAAADSYVPLPPHDDAVARLRQAFAARQPVALLDGDPGTGKTTAVVRFLEGLPAETPRLFVPAARFTRPAELHQAILFDLGADYRGLGDTELRLAVTDHLLTGLAAGTPTVLVLDEAQHLADDVLEEVRLLGNVRGRNGPAAFVVLVALPGLRDRLGEAGLAAFAQRLAARHRLDPLAPADAARLARGRLGPGADDEAVDLLAAHAGGPARLVVQAVDAALALAPDGVDAVVAIEALTRLGLYDESRAGPAVLPQPVRRPRKRKAA